MKTIVSACISLFLALPAFSGESKLTKEQAVKIALLVIEQPKYREWTTWYSKIYCEAPSYDREDGLWHIPNPSYVISWAADGPPYFEIRDADGYYRIGRGAINKKAKFQMSPQLRKQIRAIVTGSEGTDNTRKN